MRKQSTEPAGDIPSGISLSPAQDQAINRILADLVEKCPAKFVLLVELSGMPISVQGDRIQTDIPSLGALVAGDLAASKEIASLTGQYQQSQLVIREGAEAVSFICEAGSRMVLFARIRNDVPIGWARLVIRQASHILGEVLLQPPENATNLFLDVSQEKLSSLIDGDLDSMWNG